MLVNLFRHPETQDKFDLIYSYRHYAAYETGLHQHISESPQVIPLALVEPSVDYAACKPWSLTARSIHVMLFKLWRFFRQHKPDILFINNGGYPGAISCRLAVVAGHWAGIRRIVMNVNNLACPPNTALDPWLDGCARRYVTRFVTASRAAGERLASVRNMPREHFLQIPNTLAERDDLDAIPACLRSELGIAPSVPVIGSVGLLIKRKGYEVLINTLGELKARKPQCNFKVVIVGEGEERTALTQRISRNGLQDHVLLPGYKNDVVPYIKDMDIFVMPSTDLEDMPYAILEAMRLGKPVIGTQVAGIPEQIENGVNGYVVMPGDSRQLADAILRLLSDPAQRRQMGEAGRKRYEQMFNYQTTMKKYLELFSAHATISRT